MIEKLIERCLESGELPRDAHRKRIADFEFFRPNGPLARLGQAQPRDAHLEMLEVAFYGPVPTLHLTKEEYDFIGPVPGRWVTPYTTIIVDG